MKKNNKLLVLTCLVIATATSLLLNTGLFQVSANNVLGTGVNVTESTADENIAVLDDTQDILTLTQEINTTTHKTYINVSAIYHETFNCTSWGAAQVGSICWYLDQMNASLSTIEAAQNLTAAEIWNYSMSGLAGKGFAADSTIRTIFGMNETIQDIYTNTSYIKGVVDDIYTNTSYIKGVVDIINNTVNTIDATVDNIYANVSYLYDRENCSGHTGETNSKCWYLHNINQSVATIEAAQNLTAAEIWNYSLTNLAARGFATDSAAVTIWTINDTVTDVNTTANYIQSKVDNIYANVSYLYDRENCSGHTGETNSKCWYLHNINQSVATIEAAQNLTAVEIWNYSLTNLAARGFATDSTGMLLRNTSDITGFIWERFKRFNYSVLNSETVLSWSLNSTSNITISYNVTVPAKEGFDNTDYLPVRWKFWFINNDNQKCVNQVRQFRNVDPYCNPIEAQYVGQVGSDINVNITLRPALEVGNYTVIRELEVDPNQVWISYGRGPLGTLEVKESTADPEMTGKSDVEGDESTWKYIDKTQWDSFDPTGPVATLLTLQGRLVDSHGMPLYWGSIDVTISNSVAEMIVWDNSFNNAISNGNFQLLLGAAKELSMIPGKDYRMDVVICDGPTVDLNRYHCETFTIDVKA